MILATCGSLLFSKIKGMVIFDIANVVILLIVMARQALRLHLGVLRLCSRRKCHHPCVLLEESRQPAVCIPRSDMKVAPDMALTHGVSDRTDVPPNPG
jgi:hypothetical protein